MSRSSIGRSTRSETKEWPKVAIIVLALLSGSATAHPSDNTNTELGSGSTRVAGVQDVLPNEYPFLVSINKLCGGSIITQDYILTAAQCVAHYPLAKTRFGDWLVPLEDIWVKLGAHDMSDDEDGYFIRIMGVMIHEKYNATTSSNDIAILRYQSLSKSSPTIIGRRLIARIALPDKEDNIIDEESLTVVGWGSYNYSLSGLQPPNPTPNKMSLVSMPNEVCREREPCKGNPDDWETKLCTDFTLTVGNEFLVNAGSPLIREFRSDDSRPFEQVGIALYGPDRPMGAGQPRAYARLSKYLDWIRMNTPEVWPITS